MNAASSRSRSTGSISSDMSAIWPGALLVVYLACTGLVLVLGRARVTPGAAILHFILLAAIAASTWLKMVPRWLRDWAPLLVLLVLYSEMPQLIRAAGHDQLMDPQVIAWEGRMFGSQPAQAWATRWPSRGVSEILHAAYLSYYGIIFIVPIALYRRAQRLEFHAAVFALMSTFVVCFALYIVFPVAGPRYLWPATSAPGPARAFTIWLLEARSSRGTAFPSSHVAVAVTQTIIAARYFGMKAVLIGLPTTGLALGAIYGGFHYAVDVIAGAVVGALVTGVALGIIGRASRAPQTKAMAPT